MKSRVLICIVVLSLFVTANIFSQNVNRSDPFQGIWLSRLDGERLVTIFINDIIILLDENFEVLEIMDYSVSEGVLRISEESDEYFKYTILNENRILVEQEDFVWILDRLTQTGVRALEAIENFFDY